MDELTIPITSKNSLRRIRAALELCRPCINHSCPCRLEFLKIVTTATLEVAKGIAPAHANPKP